MTKSIQIGTTLIHQSENGLFSLNDLWAASGSNNKHRPSLWLRYSSAKELIKELEALNSASNIQNTSSKLGTFVCKQLAYAYAMWLSPKFYLLVINTFDSVLNSTTTDELLEIKDQLNWAMGELSNMETRHPNHKSSLSSILGLSTIRVQPYFAHLVSIGEVEKVLIPQPPKALYRPTRGSKTVIGQHRSTLLFYSAVKALFPVQTDLMDESKAVL
ncbi:MAG: KilA-N domain-containing protein [Methylococcales bacterium]|nr:KilA-N domain-containing protein [Methylococcales bacterium]